MPKQAWWGLAGLSLLEIEIAKGSEIGCEYGLYIQ